MSTCSSLIRVVCAPLSGSGNANESYAIESHVTANDDECKFAFRTRTNHQASWIGPNPFIPKCAALSKDEQEQTEPREIYLFAFAPRAHQFNNCFVGTKKNTYMEQEANRNPKNENLHSPSVSEPYTTWWTSD